jgi:hypothetical protein
VTREELQATAAEIRRATRAAQGLPPELISDEPFYLLASLMRSEGGDEAA